MRYLLLILAFTYSQSIYAAVGGPRKVDAGLIRNGAATLTVPTTTDTLVGRATTDTLSNKSFSDAVTMDELGETPSTPASGKRKLYPKDDGFYQVDSAGTERKIGSGGGGGGEDIVALDSNWAPNQPDNSTFEATAGTWAAFADSASATPEDLTGGSPNTTCARTTSGGEVLNGAASLKMTLSSGASRQGEGCSNLVYIPEGFRRSTLYWEFKYLTSGTFALGDVIPVVYDVTNSVLLDSTVISGIGSGGKGVVKFMPSSTTAQVRIGLYVARTSTGALSVMSDDHTVSTRSAPVGMAGSDTLPYTATFDNITVGSQSVFYTRLGDRMLVTGTVTPSGSSGSPFAIGLPAGLNIDSTKTTANQQVGQYFQMQTASTTVYASGSEANIVVFYDGSNTNKVFIASNIASNAFTKLNGSTLSNTPQKFWFNVPIAGWSAGVTMASSSSFKISSYLANGTRVTGSAPAKLGEYRTLRRDASDTTFTDNAPDTSPSVSNGIRIYGGNGFGSQDTSGEPTRYEIFIGKNKHYKVEYYKSTGRADRFSAAPHISGTNGYGVLEAYDPASGILSLTQLATGATTSAGFVGREPSLSPVTDGYTDIEVADHPLGFGIDGWPVTSSVGNVRTEVAHITANSSSCAVSSQIGNWLSGSCSSPATGRYQYVVNSGIFTVTPYCTVTKAVNNSQDRVGWFSRANSSATIAELNTGSGSGGFSSLGNDSNGEYILQCTGVRP